MKKIISKSSYLLWAFTVFTCVITVFLFSNSSSAEISMELMADYQDVGSEKFVQLSWISNGATASSMILLKSENVLEDCTSNWQLSDFEYAPLTSLPYFRWKENLEPGTEYYFKIYEISTNGTCLGELSNAVSMTTPNPDIDITIIPEVNIISPFHSEVLSGEVELLAGPIYENHKLIYKILRIATTEEQEISSQIQEGHYLASLDTAEYENGNYYLIAELFNDGAADSSSGSGVVGQDQVMVNIYNEVVEVEPEPELESEIEALSVNFIYPNSGDVVNDSVAVRVNIEGDPDEVVFRFEKFGSAAQEHEMICNEYVCTYHWNTTNFETDIAIYELRAIARSGSITESSNILQVSVNNRAEIEDTEEDMDATSTIETEIGETTEETKIFKIDFLELENVIYETRRVRVRTNFSAKNLNFHVFLGDSTKLLSEYAGIRYGFNDYYFDWNFLNNENYGKYKLVVIAENSDGEIIEEVREIEYRRREILVIEEQSLPENEIEDDNSLTSDEVLHEKDHQEETIDEENTMEDVKEEIDEEVNEEDILIEKEIFIEEEIAEEEVEEEKSLPIQCSNNNITDKEQCHIFLGLDFKCREKQILTQANCDKYLFQLTVAKECRDENILNHRDCEKYLFEKNFPLECVENSITDKKECDEFLDEKTGSSHEEEQEKRNIEVEEKMSPECEEADIETKEDCNEYMYSLYSEPICLEWNIKNTEDCNSFIFNKFFSKIECRNDDKWQCMRMIKQDYLGVLLQKQNRYDSINEKLDNASTTKIDSVEILEDVKEVIPIERDIEKITVMKAQEETIFNKDGELIIVPPILLILDADNDGLTDEFERRLGLDPFNNDSDNDGYLDGDEIKNGYNPLGVGKFRKESLAPVEVALINREAFEHPKVKGIESEEFVVEDLNSSTSTGHVFSGKGPANAIITIYIYSELPVVATVKTDKFGNWKYVFKESLKEGNHEVYVALNDNTGKVVKKSSPLSFLVKEAQAVTISDFVTTPEFEEADEVDSILNIYMIIVVALIISSIALFVLYLNRYGKQRQDL
jgi:hypothetical protein